MALSARFERATYRIEDGCSVRLSYESLESPARVERASDWFEANRSSPLSYGDTLSARGAVRWCGVFAEVSFA